MVNITPRAITTELMQGTTIYPCPWIKLYIAKVAIDATASLTPQLSNRDEAIVFFGLGFNMGRSERCRNDGSVLGKCSQQAFERISGICQEFLEDLGWHLLSRQSVERLRVVGSGKVSPPSSFTLLGVENSLPHFSCNEREKHPLQKGIISPIFLTFNEPQYHHPCNTMLSSLQTFSPSTFF